MEELKGLAEVVEKTQVTKEEVERAIVALDDLFTQHEDVLDDRTRVEMIDLRAKLVKKLQAEISQVTDIAQNKAKPARRRVIPIKEGEPEQRTRRKKVTAFRRDRDRKPKEDNSGLIATVGAGAVLGLLLLLGSGE
jgi:cell envelope opacity-associated protein A